MTARQATLALKNRLGMQGIYLSFDEANTLRRAQLTLHRWAEQECGDSNSYGSWSIERDENTGIPYMCRYPHDRAVCRSRIPDREAGALRRIKAICKEHGLHYYHQTDPRGCALYVGKGSLPDYAYTRGVSCCA